MTPTDLPLDIHGNPLIVGGWYWAKGESGKLLGAGEVFYNIAGTMAWFSPSGCSYLVKGKQFAPAVPPDFTKGEQGEPPDGDPRWEFMPGIGIWKIDYSKPVEPEPDKLELPTSEYKRPPSAIPEIKNCKVVEPAAESERYYVQGHVVYDRQNPEFRQHALKRYERMMFPDPETAQAEADKLNASWRAEQVKQ